MLSIFTTELGVVFFPVEPLSRTRSTDRWFVSVAVRASFSPLRFALVSAIEDPKISAIANGIGWSGTRKPVQPSFVSRTNVKGPGQN